jgi:flagellar biosynthesis protein FliR
VAAALATSVEATDSRNRSRRLMLWVMVELLVGRMVGSLAPAV